MFVVLLTYKAGLDVVDQYRTAHWEHLDKASADGMLLAAGRQVTGKGGVLLMRGDREAVEICAAADPFVVNDVTDFEIFEFEPTRIAPGLEGLAQ